ncbi:MAG: hypothetical protein RR540_01265 [Oscillospiraceae bacterium]
MLVDFAELFLRGIFFKKAAFVHERGHDGGVFEGAVAVFLVLAEFGTGD